MTDEAQGPLSGVTVIDMTRALSGPYGSLLLVGLGATVVRIEPPAGDGREAAPYLGKDGPALRRKYPDDVSTAHLIRHRGKQSITLNLKHPDARRIFQDLVKQADVVFENFTRGTAERLGVGYSQAVAVKPDIIYCSLSGYGQEGAPGGGKAMDGTIQAESGVMMVSGNPSDPPVRIGLPIADLGAPLYAVIGIVSALYHRAKTGEGQYIDVSMLGALTSLIATEAYDVYKHLGLPTRSGNTVPRLSPFGVYPSADGAIVLAAFGEETLQKLWRLMGRPELCDDPRFSSQAGRLENHAHLDEAVGNWTRTLSSGELTQLLGGIGAMAAEVRKPEEAVFDERVLNRGEVVRIKHPDYDTHILGTGVPIMFSRTKASLPPGTFALGQHNSSIYGETLGYSEDELVRLKAEGAI